MVIFPPKSQFHLSNLAGARALTPKEGIKVTLASSKYKEIEDKGVDKLLKNSGEKRTWGSVVSFYAQKMGGSPLVIILKLTRVELYLSIPKPLI